MFNSEVSFERVIIATNKRARRLFYAQMVLVALCYIAIAAAITLKILGGYSAYVFYVAIAGMICGFLSIFPGRIVSKVQKQNDLILAALEAAVKDRESNIKIPLGIGFANLSGDDLNEMMAEDSARLGELFTNPRIVPNHQIPSAEILFIYAHLNEDGTFKGMAQQSGVRQIVQSTNAAIVVLASPNTAESIKNAVALPGPKTANIVFTIDRNGAGFTRFFTEIFEKMRDGKEMLSAWVEIAPQHPNANPSYAPQTVLVAEGGRIAFPKSANGTVNR